MARDINQKMRFNDAELSLLKALFADNTELLFTIRKVLLQFKLTEQEEASLKGMINDTTFTLLKKVFLPEIDPDAPLFQLADMVLGLGGDIKDKMIDQVALYIQAKDLEIRYMEQQVAVLKDTTIPVKLSLSDMASLKMGKTRDENDVFISVIARNYLLSYIDTNLQQIKYLAGLKTETVEETKARLARDSAK